MSPELRNKILDPININNNNYDVGIKSDIFSIGMIFLRYTKSWNVVLFLGKIAEIHEISEIHP